MLGLLVGGAIILGGIGLTNGFAERDAKAKELKAQKEYQEEMYRLKKAQAKMEFKAAKEEATKNAQRAFKQADITDLAQDISEKTLSDNFNTAIDNLYLSGANDTYNWNMQEMQQGTSEGAAYAGLASSGVRSGSSLSDAVEMQSATNSELLQFSKDAKRRSDNNNLSNVLTALAGNKLNIQQNRISADWTRQDAQDLIDSYGLFGRNSMLYYNQMAQLKKSNEYTLAALDRDIKRNSPGSFDYWMGAATGFFSGASSGLQTGYNIHQLGTMLNG